MVLIRGVRPYGEGGRVDVLVDDGQIAEIGARLAIPDTADVIDATDQVFTEEQVFRIDHYLAKETVQNILVFRLTNPIFASIWNGEKVGDNPWQATTLDWHTPTPPPHGNFPSEPHVVRGPYEYSAPGHEHDFLPQAEFPNAGHAAHAH